MRLTTFSSLLILSASAIAQNWCPPGAVWNHTYYGCFGCYDTGYVRTAYAGDTIILGSTCQVLDVRIHAWSLDSGIYSQQNWSPMITRGQEDLVEKWNGSSFDTLFHFAAVPGDSWDMTGDGWLIVSVLDTGHATVNGLSLRYLVTDLGDPAPDTVFARLGLPRYYMDGYAILFEDLGLGGLRCYEDNAIDYSLGPGPACDFTLGSGKEMAQDHCELFPNPGTDRFTLTTPTLWSATLIVYDPFGRQILTQQRPSPMTTVDASTWCAGVYHVLVRNQYGDVRTLQWVKQ